MSFSPVIVPPLPRIGTSHWEHDVVHQFDFATDEDVIMCEASRSLRYGSSEYYVRATSALVPPRNFPQDEIIENQSQSVAFVAPQTQPPFHSDTNDVISNKKRTRRPNTKHIEKGNNPFGHFCLRLRCVQCRTWRQKCEYDHVELPCTQCAKKGLRCGKADKVWGRERQRQESNTALRIRMESEIEYSYVDLVGFIVRPPESERISSFEEMCISYYLERFRSGSELSFVIRHFGRNVGSKAVRSAIIVESIGWLRKTRGVLVDEHQELDYLVRCYHHMQVDIEQNKFIVSVYACYYLCEYLWLDSPIEEISKHVTGLYLSVSHVREEPDMIDLPERLLLFGWCACAVSFLLCMVYRRNRNAINARIALTTLKSAMALNFADLQYVWPKYLSDVLLFLFENLGFHVNRQIQSRSRCRNRLLHGRTLQQCSAAT